MVHAQGRSSVQVEKRMPRSPARHPQTLPSLTSPAFLDSVTEAKALDDCELPCALVLRSLLTSSLQLQRWHRSSCGQRALDRALFARLPL